jgi:L-ascorbate metabolism protein UlaG (beta-lactamase superfamily)
MLLPIVVTQAKSQDTVTLSYLGTAGWKLTDGKIVVLIDPYLTRFKMNTPNDPVLPSDPRPLVTPADIVHSDTSVIDAHIDRANFIVVTHSHGDHLFDVPYIARKTGALVIGTETTANFARANGVPNSQILTVKGGEDLALGEISIRVVPSLHGILRHAPNLQQPRSAVSPPRATFSPDTKPPFRFNQLPGEGGTLAYMIRIGGRQILAFGSMNYIEREVEGLRPDAALIGAMPERREIYRYTERLMRALGNPPLVLPAHWDRFNVPYDVSQQPAIDRLQSFIEEVKSASPATRVIVPKYFEPIPIPASAPKL